MRESAGRDQAVRECRVSVVCPVVSPPPVCEWLGLSRSEWSGVSAPQHGGQKM